MGYPDIESARSHQAALMRVLDGYDGAGPSARTLRRVVELCRGLAEAIDDLLGGNPEYLARAEMSARGWDNDAYLLEQLSEEDRAAYEAEYEPLLEAKKAECAEEHERVVDAGGLYILGTERHESRRIDNQLRGRAGRQGDPGETRFYLSLDDDLMRFFATGMISTVMDRLNLPEDMPIESKMVSKAIERAQSQVEGQNYELRKNVLKYDEVMNKQREVVYEQRRQLLEGADLSEKALEFVAEAVESAISTFANLETHPEEWDWDGLDATMAQLYPTKLVGTFDKETTSYPALLDAYQEEALAYYAKREEEIGKEKMRELERLVFISILDNKWREHLYEMDYLREGIGLRGYGQRDPEMEYKREGYDMFQAMMAATKDEFARYMFHVQVVDEVQEQPSPTAATHDAAPTMIDAPVDAPAAAPNGGAPKPQPAPAPAKVTASVGGGPAPDAADFEKVGRNAPCPCGSGRKYKKCHGAEV